MSMGHTYRSVGPRLLSDVFREPENENNTVNCRLTSFSNNESMTPLIQ